ncbi:hypothetical protein GCM10011372_22750 [Agromyces bauzanensis]|uniref:Uncharacterized protein n=1 Tax=Agromyces bauzanensis TaxID=1308924 RepID=A0A917PLB7_9MICO|nr:hypothetical protein GCM10011372_22750 [Agromyces bauzanensis]
MTPTWPARESLDTAAVSAGCPASVIEVWNAPPLPVSVVQLAQRAVVTAEAGVTPTSAATAGAATPMSSMRFPRGLPLMLARLGRSRGPPTDRAGT